MLQEDAKGPAPPAMGAFAARHDGKPGRIPSGIDLVSAYKAGVACRRSCSGDSSDCQGQCCLPHDHNNNTPTATPAKTLSDRDYNTQTSSQAGGMPFTPCMASRASASAPEEFVSCGECDVSIASEPEDLPDSAPPGGSTVFKHGQHKGMTYYKS